MSCCKPKCRVKSDEPNVACWLCNDIYHAKCVDLAPRTADNLREDKGLRWCCKKCIVYDVEFFSFFKNTSLGIDDIINDLNCLTKKFLKYKELFDMAPCSPKRKKTIADNPSNVLVNPIPSENVSYSSILQLPIMQSSQNNQIISPINPQIQHTPGASAQNQSVAANYTALLPEAVSNCPPNPPNKNVNSEVSQSNSTSINPVPIQTKGASNAFFPTQTNYDPTKLTVIPPRKSIFISRFAFNTTVDDINNYLKYKLNSDSDILIKKFEYTEPRTITSFKLTVPFDLYNKIIDPEFWPENTFVREYRNNNTRNNIVNLPLPDTNSKN